MGEPQTLYYQEELTKLDKTFTFLSHLTKLLPMLIKLSINSNTVTCCNLDKKEEVLVILRGLEERL